MKFKHWFFESSNNLLAQVFNEAPNRKTLTVCADWLQDQGNQLGEEMAFVLAKKRDVFSYATGNWKVRIVGDFVHVMFPTSINTKIHCIYRASAKGVVMTMTVYNDNFRSLSYQNIMNNGTSDRANSNPQNINDFKPELIFDNGDKVPYNELPEEALKLIVLGICQMV